MKKLLLVALAAFCFVSCSSIEKSAKEAAEDAINCKYDLIGAEAKDFGLSSVTLQVALAVTNLSKTKEVKMNRFEGKLYINGENVSEIKFGSYEIMPGNTDIAKATLELPFNTVGKNIAGLVTTNSIALTYKIAGKIYFDTPLGEVPFPITVEQKRDKKR